VLVGLSVDLDRSECESPESHLFVSCRQRIAAQKVNRSNRSLMSVRSSRGGAGAPPVW
jgi:hypothetical protein